MQVNQREDFTHAGIEVLTDKRPQGGLIKAAVFDFDGTLSTLRHGWEAVMRPLMLEMIGGVDGEGDAALQARVDAYINESTGIQTVYQMRWLAQQVAQRRGAAAAHDEWWYKDEYNRRLMRMVEKRIERLEDGTARADAFLMAGSVEFLAALRARGVELYVASGTDHADLVREVAVLGLKPYFSLIKGAPERRADCSKEAVMRTILQQRGYHGSELLVVGDGKVEIALGAENDAYALGVASDEALRHGLNPTKRARLARAGADAITGDFGNTDALLKLLRMN